MTILLFNSHLIKRMLINLNEVYIDFCLSHTLCGNIRLHNIISLDRNRLLIIYELSVYGE